MEAFLLKWNTSKVSLTLLSILADLLDFKDAIWASISDEKVYAHNCFDQERKKNYRENLASF